MLKVLGIDHNLLQSPPVQIFYYASQGQTESVYHETNPPPESCHNPRILRSGLRFRIEFEIHFT